MKNSMSMLSGVNKYMILGLSILVWSCAAEGDYPGVEYAPNMYHSVAYEPLTQITNEESGSVVSSIDDGVGEYYNSNPNNPHKMTMRDPVPNTIKRGEFLPYRLPKDSLDYAAKVLVNPYEATEDVLASGKALFTSYCSHCHGDEGKGSGDPTAKVGEVFQGVPSYSAGRLKTVSQGHIFHVITHGKGRMGAHASQLNQEERWKVARYVEVLQTK